VLYCYNHGATLAIFVDLVDLFVVVVVAWSSRVDITQSPNRYLHHLVD